MLDYVRECRDATVPEKSGQNPNSGHLAEMARNLALGPKKSNGIGCKLLGTTLLHVLGPKLVRILNF